jgi:cytochrome c oxidase subunit II
LPNDGSRPGKEPVSRIATRIAALGALLAVAVVAAGCALVPGGADWPGFFAPEATSAGGRRTDELYLWVFVIAVAVFVLVEGLLLWIVLRYRRRPVNGELPPQIHGNNFLEIMWTAVPALIVTWLFIMTIDVLGDVERLEPEPQGVIIDVIGFQWQWQFDYPNEGLSFIGAIGSPPVLVLPTDEPVRIRLHATDVVHSFYVPMFRYKQDNIPGRINQFDVVVDTPGTYAGQCAEFCGLLHYEMTFTVEAMGRADYDAWVAEQQAEPEPTPEPPAEGHTITLSSIDSFTYDPASLTAPADTPIIFDFHNVDTEQPHNVAIDDATPEGAWHGMPIAAPGESLTYVSPPLAAGEYEFFCTVHPTTMRGSLTVGP